MAPFEGCVFLNSNIKSLTLKVEAELEKNRNQQVTQSTEVVVKQVSIFV